MKENTSRNIFGWHVAGFMVIIVLGSALHFFYDWFGKLPLVGLFSPVNESTWEHLKMGFWALAFFTIAEYAVIGRWLGSYFTGKLIGIISMEAFIVLFFYGYEAVLGRNDFVLNLVSYGVGAVLCQLFSFLIVSSAEKRDRSRAQKNVNLLSFFALLVVAALFMLFTFLPPHNFLFIDPINHTYGALPRP